MIPALFLSLIYVIATVIHVLAEKSIARATRQARTPGRIPKLIVRIGMFWVFVLTFLGSFPAIAVLAAIEQKYGYKLRNDYASCVMDAAPSAVTTTHARELLRDCKQTFPNGISGVNFSRWPQFSSTSECMTDLGTEAKDEFIAREIMRLCRHMSESRAPVQSVPQEPPSTPVVFPQTSSPTTPPLPQSKPASMAVSPLASTPKDALIHERNNPKFDKCWGEYLQTINALDPDAPLGDFSAVEKRAKSRIKTCLQ